jgi:hypothetical protein
VQTIPERKVTPMLPEPTLPKPAAAATAPPESAVMIPLFCVPDDAGPDLAPGHRATRSSSRGRRANSRANPLASPRRPAGRAPRAPRATTSASGTGKESADLLAVTAQRLRRAMARSFLRHGIPGDLEAAVHAAMNVVEPVLQARDTEILRLRRLMTPKLPAR